MPSAHCVASYGPPPLLLHLVFETTSRHGHGNLFPFLKLLVAPPEILWLPHSLLVLRCRLCPACLSVLGRLYSSAYSMGRTSARTLPSAPLDQSPAPVQWAWSRRELTRPACMGGLRLTPSLASVAPRPPLALVGALPIPQLQLLGKCCHPSLSSCPALIQHELCGASGPGDMLPCAVRSCGSSSLGHASPPSLAPAFPWQPPRGVCGLCVPRTQISSSSQLSSLQAWLLVT